MGQTLDDQTKYTKNENIGQVVMFLKRNLVKNGTRKVGNAKTSQIDD